MPRHLLSGFMFAILLPACGVPEVVREHLFGGETPREQYVESLAYAGLSESLMARAWVRAGDAALAAALPVTLPHRETGILLPEEPAALSYRVELRRGERLNIVLEKQGTDALEWGASGRAFLEVHRIRAPEGGSEGDDLRPLRVAWNEPAFSSIDSLAYNATTTGSYLVIIQAELLTGGPYEVELRAGASMAFPVEGHSTGSIQSFFGAERDGGRRDHHGVDVFAPRGTPVLAAGPGVVRRANETPIGGKVVWVFDEERNLSRYYAHLDSQMVVAGQPIQTGDTLGLVGNTGNARTTPPHLHFGIYARGQGPVDPFPYLHAPGRNPTPIRAALEVVGEVGEWEGGPVRIMGAAGDQYRVRAMGEGTHLQSWAPSGAVRTPTGP